MKYLLFLTFFVSNVMAHGENKPGPNGGHIRMPSNFHVELVLKIHMAKVFLSDINFKNPTTKNSSISMKVTYQTKSEEVACDIKQSFFECHIPNVTLAKTIQILATREGVKGKLVTYNLPLIDFKNSSTTENSSHHGHH